MEEKKINEIIEEAKFLQQESENQPEVIAEEEVNEPAVAEEAQIMPQPAKKSKKSKKWGLLVRTIIILALSVMFSVIIIFGFKDIYGLDFDAVDEKDVYIEKGSSTAQIAQTLYENGIIEQPLLFRVYCKLGDNGNFQYGYHTLAGNMSYSEITSELKKLAKKEDVVEVTVVEGWNLYDIALELKEKKVIADINEFVKAVERMEVSYDYLKNVPDNDYRYYKYEGYFYPDKYEFYTGTDDHEGIAKKFFANFEAHLNSEIKTAIEESEYSFDEIITIASLIQAEAGDVNEMGKVSSVFHNRLKSTLFPNLQSDVTINYVEDVIKPTVAYADQNLYDAYNTYKRTGLMPGPVCNPTKEAIRAALFPNDTNYYYFVTDHTGKYYYSTTYAQHQRNCKTAQKVNDRLKQEN
ncbi:MAG: endolytic transglycosylase MltG [Oscillospiraceae bacterium]|nr:endolytic transglycosylase MltG [Oscillospiraceae bacterium]